MSNNGKMRAFPSKKFAMIVPAKHVRMLETQQDIGWVQANDNEPTKVKVTNLREKQLEEMAKILQCYHKFSREIGSEELVQKFHTDFLYRSTTQDLGSDMSSGMEISQASLYREISGGDGFSQAKRKMPMNKFRHLSMM